MTNIFFILEICILNYSWLNNSTKTYQTVACTAIHNHLDVKPIQGEKGEGSLSQFKFQDIEYLNWKKESEAVKNVYQIYLIS